MKALQRFVVITLLAVWSFPAVSLAKPLPTPSAEVNPRPAPSSSAPAEAPSRASELAGREQQSKDLQDWKGGEGVYLYLGSGAMLVIIVLLLIILL
jgi:hypothetical protein